MTGQVGSPRRIGGETVVVICFVVLTTFYLHQSLFLERTLMSDFVGPAMFPQLVGIIALVLAGIYFFQLLVGRTPAPPGDEHAETGASVETAKGRLASLLPIIPIVLYVLILEPLGFLFATPIYIFIAMLMFGQTMVKSAVYAVTLSIGFFVLFYYLLLAQVPLGWWAQTGRVLPFVVELRRMIEG